MARKAQLQEKEWFFRDADTEDREKNDRLAAHLKGGWNDLAVVQIKRIEIGDSGWLLKYRAKP